ncbi:MAG: hypothetical protein AB7O44_04595 [Hyphomicrobiaceae bacterium]
MRVFKNPAIARGDKFEILSAPSVTREILAHLQLLIDEAEAHPSQLGEIGQKAEALHPGLGRLFDPREWSPEVKAAPIAAVVAFAAAKCSGRGTTVINVAPRLVIEMPEKSAPEAPRKFDFGPLPIRFKR